MDEDYESLSQEVEDLSRRMARASAHVEVEKERWEGLWGKLKKQYGVEDIESLRELIGTKKKDLREKLVSINNKIESLELGGNDGI